MTNDTKAPERIWAVTEEGDISADILGDVYAQQMPDGMVGNPVEYTRHDLHLSLVASAYEDAADTLRHAYTSSDGWIHPSNQGDIEDILARTPTDAQAARDARDQRIRDKALREALKIIHDEGWIGDTHNRIVTLIEKDKADE